MGAGVVGIKLVFTRKACCISLEKVPSSDIEFWHVKSGADVMTNYQYFLPSTRELMLSDHSREDEQRINGKSNYF